MQAYNGRQEAKMRSEALKPSPAYGVPPSQGAAADRGGPPMGYPGAGMYDGSYAGGMGGYSGYAMPMDGYGAYGGMQQMGGSGYDAYGSYGSYGMGGGYYDQQGYGGGGYYDQQGYGGPPPGQYQQQGPPGPPGQGQYPPGY